MKRVPSKGVKVVQGPICAACAAEAEWKGIIPRKQAEIITQSWDEITAKHTLHQISKAFFKMLFTYHPEMEELFYRACAGPQMFEAMSSNLLNVMVDAEAGSKDLHLIAVRHLRYNIHMEHFPKVGRELVNAFEELAEPGTFTQPVRDAWLLLWTSCSTLFADYLDVDPIVRIIAKGEFSELQKMLASTPRGFRAKRLLQELADGQTPLLRAIRSRKTNIIKLLLRDILAIRSDRSGYYYGRKDLFEAHPHIVKELVQYCPEALPDLLNGCMWQSQLEIQGYLRVNFYLEGLYGRVDEPVQETGLAALLKLEESENEIFTHPVVAAIIRRKWNQFARRRFLASEMFACLKFVIFFLEYIVVPHVATIGYVLDAALLLLSLRDVHAAFKNLELYSKSFWMQWVDAEISHAEKFGKLVQLMANPQWLYIFPDAFIIVMQIFNKVSYAEGSHKYQDKLDICAAIVVVALSIFLLRVFLASETMSVFIIIMIRMVRDVIQVFVVCLIVWFGFACAFHIILGRHGAPKYFGTLYKSGITLAGMVFGFYEFDFRVKKTLSHRVAFVMWVGFIVFVVLIIVNLLIAKLACSYDAVKAVAVALSMRKMAEEVVIVEQSLSKKERKKMWEQMHFDRPLEFDVGDPGPSGGVQLLVPVESCPTEGDRIFRFRGRADPDMPWPSEEYSRLSRCNSSKIRSQDSSASSTPMALSPSSSYNHTRRSLSHTMSFRLRRQPRGEESPLRIMAAARVVQLQSSALRIMQGPNSDHTQEVPGDLPARSSDERTTNADTGEEAPQPSTSRKVRFIEVVRQVQLQGRTVRMMQAREHGQPRDTARFSKVVRQVQLEGRTVRMMQGRKRGLPRDIARNSDSDCPASTSTSSKRRRASEDTRSTNINEPIQLVCGRPAEWRGGRATM